MNDAAKSQTGTISWCDLTVDDASLVRDFYGRVVGWESRGESMGEYEDYCMIAPDSGNTVAGICHARGPNADLPAQWLIYITVEDVDASAARCVEHGGEIVSPPRTLGNGKFCVIRDPAGAVCALYGQV